MKIGLFTDSYPPYINGVSTSVKNLKEALTELGHIVYVVTVNNSIRKYSYEENERILKLPGIPIGIYNYRASKIYSRKAAQIIKKWNLDIIHSHTEFGIGIFARILSKKFNIPIVHTYHTLYEDYTHYITHGLFPKLSKSLVKYFTKIYCVKTVSQVIVPTRKISQLFMEKYKITSNINVIPSGIDIDKFFKVNVMDTKVKSTKDKIGLKKEDFVIIFVGRLAQEKNIEFLLKAQRKLMDNHYNDIKLVIVGDGPDKKKYIDITKRLKIYDKVIFTGSISQEEIQNYYHCANVFATASNTETQGLTVIEAMAGEVIPLCINDPAFLNVVPKECIFNNQEEYIQKLLEFKKNNKLIKETKEKIKKYAYEYSLQKYASEVLKVYKKVI